MTRPTDRMEHGSHPAEAASTPSGTTDTDGAIGPDTATGTDTATDTDTDTDTEGSEP